MRWGEPEYAMNGAADIPVLSVFGEIDFSGTDEFRRRMDGLIAMANSPCVVDLSGVSFLDAAGLRCLVRATRDAERQEVQLTVRAPSPPVRRVIEVCKAPVRVEHDR